MLEIHQREMENKRGGKELDPVDHTDDHQDEKEQKVGDCKMTKRLRWLGIKYVYYEDPFRLVPSLESIDRLGGYCHSSKVAVEATGPPMRQKVYKTSAPVSLFYIFD